jgi:hypothetical protein
MSSIRSIEHFAMVNKPAIQAQFVDNRSHRATLFLPFLRRPTTKVLCVIGQNPSAADERFADKTIRYLEEFVYRLRPEYSALLVLNLYSRVDTTKSATVNPLHECCASIFSAAIREHQEFLLVYGKVRSKGPYKFPERVREVANEFRSKTVLKLDIDTPYPPHPGNKNIL